MDSKTGLSRDKKMKKLISVFLLGASNVIISPLSGIFLVVLPHLLSHNLWSCTNVGYIDTCFTIVGVPIKYLNNNANTTAMIIQ